MDQGVGYAFREEYFHGKTKDWKTFKFPNMRDLFRYGDYYRETRRDNGPFGATGIGEMTMCSTAPAVINADQGRLQGQNLRSSGYTGEDKGRADGELKEDKACAATMASR